ncbi:tyrosine-type recombinase/integrase [Bremerella alba]|uniref:Tyr recombinase domain-containing protein n=1 Tax=Bremerella alba TaxID=980252 RepID=A0A7V8V8V8_9BACT|nr:site-specific integrase [Bremerella alba]MBA2117073.1 hypothetical protein [Bremerella alba]
MHKKANVRVCDIGRRFLVLRWTDPETGAIRQKSAETNSPKEAERLAGKIEADVNAGIEVNPAKLPWEYFRECFEEDKFPLLATQAAYTYDAMFNNVERILNPRYVNDITAQRLARFQAELLKSDKRLATIITYLKHLRAALNWAKDHEMIDKVPKFRLPKQPKGSKLMRGRPITDEEFQRMLDVVSEVVGEEATESWRFFLRGIWCSGLRLSESLEVYWDRQDKIQIVLDGEFPMLRILAELEKGRCDRLLPITPEFAALLEQVPKANRNGPLFFHPSHGERWKADWYSRLACRIGRKAKVIVDINPISGKEKFAGLHDLRRSFGQRWAQKALPQHLMQLMRHESIETTLKYYVGSDARIVSQAIWGNEQPTS